MSPASPLRSLAASLLLAASASAPALAQTPYPEISHVLPGAVQRGTTSDVTVYSREAGRGFETARQVFFGGGGLRAEVPPRAANQPAQQGTIRVTAAADAEPGLHELRVATGSGTSSLAEILVVDDPVVAELPKAHGTPEAAQPVEVNRVVCGAISRKEEVDVYRFRARAGQEVTFALMGQRLLFKRHYHQSGDLDPMIILSDAKGTEIASDDDHDIGDPLLHHRFEKEGDYLVTVRDVDFDGVAHYTYALTITDRPFVTSAYPLVVPAAGPRSACAEGFGIPDGPLALAGPAGPAKPGVHQWPLLANGNATNPATFVATERPILAEAEPNDDRGHATPVPRLGMILAGRANRPNDVDLFAFALKAGRPVRFEVHARRLGSSLDSRLRVLDDKGAAVASGDDSPGSKDAVLTFKPPRDGAYTLEVTDLVHRGGPGFAYGVEAVEDEPDFAVTCDDDKLGVGPGGAAPWFVRATRLAGFEGPIEVRVEGLPPGLSAAPATIPAGVKDGCLVVRAAPDAKPAAGPVTVIAAAMVKDLDGKTRKLEHPAQPLQEVYLAGGGRAVWPVETQIAQVVEKDDIAAVHVSPDAVALKPGQQVALDVEVVRRPGFKGRVTLDIELQHLGSVFGNPLPPGVTAVEAGAKLSLAPEESKGRVLLKAAPDAKPAEKVTIAVVAYVSIDFVTKRAYSSPPIPVTIAAPAVAVR
ncbi:PPC domain-containing protein [Aquisphaera insulae]|uniref:PPC domain-containing protein n=1 Tax=Aquisphaera insulae TaxID=2712864 RepID=UPI0013ED5743|nr:PPC domain-containing protein [Aquisphaera insulae]